MNFKDWIKQFKELDNPIGELTRDILNDGKFIDSNDYKEIRRYLNIDCNACYKALQVFDQAWQQYDKDHNIRGKSNEPV